MTRLDTISIALVADIKQFRDSMRQATAEMNLTSDRMRQVSERAGQIGSALTTRISLPLAAVGAAVGKMGADFQASMNMVAATTGATGEDIQSLSNLARELGTTTQFSASQAADAMYFLASSGMSVDEVMGALPNTLLLAAAAQMDLAEASDISTNILSGYGLEVEELARVNDVLVATFQGSNTNVRQLGEAFSYVGPIAKGVGLTIEETSGLLGMLGNAGFQASRAGTALAGGLRALIDPGNEQREVLERLGVATRDSSGDLLSMTDIFRQLEESGAGTTEIIQLFGAEAGPGMAALLGFGADAIENFINSLDDVAGTAKDVADIQMEGLKGALAGLRSAFEGLAIAIFESGFGDFLEEATRKITVFGQMLAAASPETLRMATIIAGFAVVIPPTIVVLAALTTSVITLATAVAGLNLAILASPVGFAALAAGAVAVGAGVGLAKKEYDDFMRTLDQAQREVEATARSAEDAGQRTGSSLEDAGRAARSFADQLGDVASAQANTTEAAGDSAEAHSEWAQQLQTDVEEMVEAHVRATRDIERKPINIVFGGMTPEEIGQAFYEDVQQTYAIASAEIERNKGIRDAMAANAIATYEFRERLQDLSRVGGEAIGRLVDHLGDVLPALAPVARGVKSFIDDLAQGAPFAEGIGRAIGAIKTGGLSLLIDTAIGVLGDMFSRDSRATQRAQQIHDALRSNEQAIRQNTESQLRVITGGVGGGTVSDILAAMQVAFGGGAFDPFDPRFAGITGQFFETPMQMFMAILENMGLSFDDVERLAEELGISLDGGTASIEQFMRLLGDLVSGQLSDFQSAFENMVDMFDLRDITPGQQVADIIDFLAGQVGPNLAAMLESLMTASPGEAGNIIADIIEGIREGGDLYAQLGGIASEEFIAVLETLFGIIQEAATGIEGGEDPGDVQTPEPDPIADIVALFRDMQDLFRLRDTSIEEQIQGIIQLLVDNVSGPLADMILQLGSVGAEGAGAAIADIIEFLRAGGEGLAGQAIGDIETLLMALFSLFKDLPEPEEGVTEEDTTPPGDSTDTGTINEPFTDTTGRDEDEPTAFEEAMMDLHRVSYDAIIQRMTSLETQVDTLIGTNRNGFDDVAAAVRT